jgi:hypothetical protein
MPQPRRVLRLNRLKNCQGARPGARSQRQRNNWLVAVWIPAARATSEATAPGFSAAAGCRPIVARYVHGAAGSGPLERVAEAPWLFDIDKVYVSAIS